MISVANSIWLTAAVLHREHPDAEDFGVGELMEKAATYSGGYRPGLPVHASQHCVANKPPNPGSYRMLLETSRGRRRLFRPGDPFHPNRAKGKIRPEKEELPENFRSLVDWYDEIFCKREPARAVSVEPQNSSDPDMPEEIWPELQSETGYINSSGAVVLPQRLRQQLGINESTRLSLYLEEDRLVIQPITNAYINRIRGCLKGPDSLVEALQRERRDDRKRERWLP